MSALFITATGTGTGKTFVTAGLLRYFRETGVSARGLKPVLSGYDGPEGSDSAFLLDAMGIAVSDQAVAAISPFRFKAPLSPDQAAAKEGRAIDFAALLAFCRAAAAEPGLLLIEGVGGAMVPLDATHTTADWMAGLGLPVLLVAGSYLGSISHTLTAAAALKAAGIAIAALVVNDSGPAEGPGTIPLADITAALARFLPGLPILALPRNPPVAAFAPVAEILLAASGAK